MWQGASPVRMPVWAGVSPVPVPMWQGVSPVPVQMWRGASPVRMPVWAGVSPARRRACRSSRCPNASRKTRWRAARGRASGRCRLLGSSSVPRGNGLPPARSLHRDWAHPLPSLHWDWARPGHMGTGTRLSATTWARGLGSPIPAICAGLLLAPPTSAPGRWPQLHRERLGSPLPHLQRDRGSPLPRLHRDRGSPLPRLQRERLGSPLPHLHRDSSHRCHICTWTGAQRCHICTGTGAHRCHVCSGSVAQVRDADTRPPAHGRVEHAAVRMQGELRTPSPTSPR
jgi:hypothetical protein